MSRGAPFTTDWLGTSPLHLTAQFGKLETCEVLLRAGCSRDARTKVDKTPLHVAAQEGHPEICELLLSHGADVDARDMLRMTPLHWAVERGCSQTVETLLKHGANTDVESKFDKTPFEIASENGRPDIFEILQNAESLRLVAIDNGDRDNEGLNGDSSSNLVVSQQEIVTTGNGVLQKKTLQITNSFQLVKSDSASSCVSDSEKPVPLQISLDPVQIALNSVGDVGDVSDIQEPDPVDADDEDEAIKLLASHGIRMLPEDPMTLSLTEAGKLALSLSSSTTLTNHNVLTNIKTSNTNISGVPKLVTLKSAPSKLKLTTSTGAVTTSPSKKPIQVIKLTPAQAEAFKKSKAAGQIIFSKDKLLSSPNKIPDSDYHNDNTLSNNILPENILDVKIPSPEPPRKVIKLENGRKLAGSKEELQERLREQLKQKEEECERIKAQLEALSQ